jgi:hypothetical protein
LDDPITSFYQIVYATVKNHICTHTEVIDMCSRWLITEKRDATNLEGILRMYGSIRDLGYPHNVVVNSIISVIDAASTTTFPNNTTMTVFTKEISKEDPKEIVKEDMRLIRED